MLKNHTMKIRLLILNMLFPIIVLQSCSKDDSKVAIEEPVAHQVMVPILDSLTKDVLFADEEVIIRGEHLVDSENETRLFVNNEEVTYTFLAESEIKFNITGLVGKNRVFVEIGPQISEELPFYVFEYGWNEMELTKNYILRLAHVLNDDDNIYAMVDVLESPTSFYYQSYKLSPTALGYSPILIDAPGGNQSNLIINDNGDGLTTNGYGITLFTDKFETLERTFSGKDGYDPGGTNKLILEGDTIFYSSGMHTYTYSPDRGVTLTKGHTAFLHDSSENGNKYYGGVSEIAKSPTTGDIYALGIYWKNRKNGGTPAKTNLIMKSNDYLNWQVLDTVTANLDENLWGSKFIDTDLILTKDQDNDLLKSIDLAQTWSVLHSGVLRFAIRSRNEWYIYTTENTVESTTDGGQTWVVELELDEDNAVSSIDFANNKVLIAGLTKSYIKFEK